MGCLELALEPGMTFTPSLRSLHHTMQFGMAFPGGFPGSRGTGFKSGRPTMRCPARAILSGYFAMTRLPRRGSVADTVTTR